MIFFFFSALVFTNDTGMVAFPTCCTAVNDPNFVRFYVYRLRWCWIFRWTEYIRLHGRWGKFQLRSFFFSFQFCIFIGFGINLTLSRCVWKKISICSLLWTFDAHVSSLFYFINGDKTIANANSFVKYEKKSAWIACNIRTWFNLNRNA